LQRACLSNPAEIGRISSILYVFFTDPTYRPRDFTIQEELNPTKDKTKARILRLDQIVDWRLKIYSCFRCNLSRNVDCGQMAWFHGKHITMPHMCQRIYPHEQKYRRQYLNRQECWAFWHYYWAGAEEKELEGAVRKIGRNLDRRRIEVES
jgi:hypothetical protein